MPKRDISVALLQCVIVSRTKDVPVCFFKLIAGDFNLSFISVFVLYDIDALTLSKPRSGIGSWVANCLAPQLCNRFKKLGSYSIHFYVDQLISVI